MKPNGWNKIRQYILDDIRVSSNDSKRQMKWVQPMETIRNLENNQRRDTKQDQKL
jgi:hypothetical protein